VQPGIEFAVIASARSRAGGMRMLKKLLRGYAERVCCARRIATRHQRSRGIA
jgi:hypothetical protein